MAKLPYYPLYVDDYDNDDKVRSMSLAEVGLFQLALNEGWRAGSIPDDAEELALAIRRKPSTVQPYWEKVKSCFVPNEAGRLINPKQEKVRAEVEKKSQAAKKSAEAGWEKRRGKQETGEPKPTSMPTANANASQEEANASKNESESSTRAFGLVCFDSASNISLSEKQKFWKAEAFDSFRDAYPLAVNDWESQVFMSMIQTPDDAETALSNIELYKQTDQWQRAMIPSAENFLKKGIWKVAPKFKIAPAKPLAEDSMMQRIMAKMTS